MSKSFSYNVGQEGSAEWAGDGASYPGKITAVRSRKGHANEYHVAFEFGDKEWAYSQDIHMDVINAPEAPEVEAQREEQPNINLNQMLRLDLPPSRWHQQRHAELGDCRLMIDSLPGVHRHSHQTPRP